MAVMLVKNYGQQEIMQIRQRVNRLFHFYVNITSNICVINILVQLNTKAVSYII